MLLTIIFVTKFLERVINAVCRPAKHKSYSVVCTTTYSTYSYVIKYIIKKHWYILSSDSVGKRIFADLPLFFSLQSEDIKDFLVKSDTYVRDGMMGMWVRMLVFILVLNARHVKMYAKDALSFGVV